MASNESDLDNKRHSTLYEGIKKIAENDIIPFTGGGGSNDCVVSGPFTPYLDFKDDMSEDSFESTDHTDCTVDLCEKEGLSHSSFQFNDVVWVKRPLLPWFPGIIVNPNDISKDFLKSINASSPNKHLLESWKQANEKQHFVFLFHRKRLWLWVAESKLRPFCNENDSLFLEKAKNYCTDKYNRDINKGYKRAKKLACAEMKEHHHYNFLNQFRHLFHHTHTHQINNNNNSNNSNSDDN